MRDQLSCEGLIMYYHSAKVIVSVEIKIRIFISGMVYSAAEKWREFV
jgi:hypothetical protein